MWQGTPVQTRDALVQWVWGEMPRWEQEQPSAEKIEGEIYDKSTRDNAALQSNIQNTRTHEQQLRNRVAQTTSGTRVVYQDDDTWRFYCVANWHSPYAGVNRVDRRIAVHVNPNQIYGVIDHLNTNLLDLNYVESFKVSLTPRSVEQRLDNIDIYFQDDRAAATDNAQAIYNNVLIPILGQIVVGHPAMMTELHPGIGTGDDPGGGESFSGLRSKAICEAVMDHLRSMRHCNNVGDFQHQVVNRLFNAGIDRLNPSRQP